MVPPILGLVVVGCCIFILTIAELISLGGLTPGVPWWLYVVIVIATFPVIGWPWAGAHRLRRTFREQIRLLGKRLVALVKLDERSGVLVCDERNLRLVFTDGGGRVIEWSDVREIRTVAARGWPGSRVLIAIAGGDDLLLMPLRGDGTTPVLGADLGKVTERLSLARSMFLPAR
jgi:hypothetical protein